MRKTTTLTAALALTLTPAALAQHSDVLLLQDPSGQLVTGTFDFIGGAVSSTNSRVFEGEFESLESDEPGFNARGTTAGYPTGYDKLPGNANVGFDLVSFDAGGGAGNLQYWDGLGAVDFAPATSATLTAKFSLDSAVANGADADVDGFVMVVTDANGELHRHLTYELGGTTGSGFYAWGLELEVDGVGTAAPIYLIHGNGSHSEAQHEAAADFFVANVVPEPASAALLAAGVMALVRRRR